MPSSSRNVSSLVARVDGSIWLFDCGEGTQHQMIRAGVKPGKVERIFISHMHGDHTFGLPGVLCYIAHRAAPDRPPIHLYGPIGLRKFLRSALRATAARIDASFCIHELLPRQRPHPAPKYFGSSPRGDGDRDLPGPSPSGAWDVVREGSWTVQAAPLQHRVPTWGFVLQEDPKPGRLDIDSVQKDLGINPGPDYGLLKSAAGDGLTSVKLSNGAVVNPFDYVAGSTPGRKIVILGDTRDSCAIAPTAQNADLLVHEATMGDALMRKAMECGHSTPSMAAAFAAQIKTRTLVLNHFSARYSTKNSSQGHVLDDPEFGDLPDTAQTVSDLADQARSTLARSTCPNTTVIPAADFMKISVDPHSADGPGAVTVLK